MAFRKAGQAAIRPGPKKQTASVVRTQSKHVRASRDVALRKGGRANTGTNTRTETGVCKNNVPPPSEPTAPARGSDANLTYMSAPSFNVVVCDVSVREFWGVAK